MSISTIFRSRQCPHCFEGCVGALRYYDAPLTPPPVILPRNAVVIAEEFSLPRVGQLACKDYIMHRLRIKLNFFINCTKSLRLKNRQLASKWRTIYRWAGGKVNGPKLKFQLLNGAESVAQGSDGGQYQTGEAEATIRPLKRSYHQEKRPPLVAVIHSDSFWPRYRYCKLRRAE